MPRDRTPPRPSPNSKRWYSANLTRNKGFRLAAMNSQHILYDANIPQTGKGLKRALLFLIAAGVIGISFALWEMYQRFWWNVMDAVVVILLGIFVAGMAVRFREVSRWSRRQGRYKV